jgi:colicin import membrane protein
MRCQPRHYLLNAIVLIAFYAIPGWSAAQSTVESADARSTPVVRAQPTPPEDNERVELMRIQQERVKAGTAHEVVKAQCYQRFLVNDCLLAARDDHNAQLADLKRQENSLNDTQRKRRGALQVQRIETNTSPQRQLEQAEQRGNALANTAKREQRQAEKVVQQARAPKTARVKEQKMPLGAAPEAKSKPQPKAKKMAPKQAKEAPKAQSTAAYDQRIKDAQAHRAEVEARVKKNKSPPAAALPIPQN